MTLGAFARVVPDTFRVTTGTQDFTSPGVGTPKGFVVVVSWATTLSDTVFRDGAGAGWGASDGTRERAMWAVSADNVGTQDAVCGGSQTKVARLLDPSDQSTALEVSFDSFITDGVRLEVTTTNGDAFQVAVLLLGGDDVECYAFDEIGDGSTVTTGFQADFVLTGYMSSTDESDVNEAFFQSGIATRTNPTEGMACSIQGSDDAATTAQGRRGKYATQVAKFFRIGSTGTDTFGSGTGIENYTSTGFDVYKVGGLVPDGPRICGLAVKWPLGYALQESGTSPASTGSQSKTFPGFRTSAIYTCSSPNIGADEVRTGAGGGVGFADLSQQRALQYTDQNNVTTSNSGSRMAEAIVDAHNGARSTHHCRADWNGPLSTGFSLDWTIVDATARYYSVLALEVSPFSLSGGGELAGLAASGVAVQIFTASGGGEVVAIAAAGVADQTFAASGSGALAGLAGSGVATQVFSASGGGAIAGLAGSGVAVQTTTLAGGGALVGLAAIGAAVQVFTASGAGSIAGIVGSGVVVQTFSLTGGGELAGLAGSGAASLTFSVIGLAELSLLQASGALALSFSLSGGGGVSPIQAVGAARLLFVLVGTGEIQGINAAGIIFSGERGVPAVSDDLIVADSSVDLVVDGASVDLLVPNESIDLTVVAISMDLEVPLNYLDLIITDDAQTLTLES